jgi:hypothetical protein
VSFPYVCPEPCLGKKIISSIKWHRKKDAWCSDLPQRKPCDIRVAHRGACSECETKRHPQFEFSLRLRLSRACLGESYRFSKRNEVAEKTRKERALFLSEIQTGWSPHSLFSPAFSSSTVTWYSSDQRDWLLLCIPAPFNISVKTAETSAIRVS